MKSTNAVVLPGERSVLAERMLDYLELTKPRIAVLVLLTVWAGGYAASRGTANPLLLLHAVIGTALVAAGSSVLNQLSEQDVDKRMRRTADRPLPSGRVSASEARLFAGLLAISGSVYLAVLVNYQAMFLAIVSLVLYAWVYTPMKRYTTLNTAVGAIPGALPPLIGWSAAGMPLDLEAWSLFGIVYCWQFPHFYAIAWLHREDYERAGLQMLPTSELGRRLTGLQVVSHGLLLLPVSLAPSYFGLTGTIYFWGTLVLGLQFVGYGIWFLLEQTDARARLLLWASLVYLPVVFGLLTLDLA
ncbi:MAG: heme o synthase [Planctomycetota bacterium]